MKGKHLPNLLLSVSVGLLAGYPPASLADDTDIYLGISSANQEIRPNVLFILDTSGSMSDYVSGTGMDRLDNMKAAMNRILTEANNINVGLMRFTDPGGPVLWPVSYIDEDTDVVTGAVTPGMDVNVRILPTSTDGLSSTDDAIERAGHGMDLTSTQLELGAASALGAEVTQEVRVADQTDNAEEEIGSGDTVTGSNMRMQESQINAVRFQGLNIPVGAQILEAGITFTASENSHSDVSFRISGENTADSQPFYLGDHDGCGNPTPPCWNVAYRYRTYANEVWEPGRWNRNNQYDTPDLSRLVQEIVGPPGSGSAPSGWTPGNAMGFILQPLSGNRDRAVYTYEGAGSSTSRRAKLTVRYAPVTAAAKNEYIGLRFQDVAVPKGAHITNAYVEFTPEVTSGWGDDPAGVKIWGEKVPDAPTFGSEDNHITNRMANKTDASVAWNSGNGSMSAWWDIGTTYQTPDLRELVQEIVDQDGWCGNNAMAFLLEKDQDGPRIAKSYEGDPSKAPILRIDYDESSIPADTCIQQWVQRQIAEDADDAEQSGHNIYLGGNALNMNGDQTNGLRFQDLPIAQGETILEARLILTAYDDTTGATTLRLYGQDTDDAPAFANSHHNISGRTRTSASVDWVMDDWDVAGGQHISPDLKDIVQEIVDRSGWQSGNALAFIQTHQSGGSRDAVTYHNNPAQGAILRVKIGGTRDTGGTGVKTVRQEMMEIIDNFDHSGYTPIVDTLYEAARYYRGEGVYYGMTRGKDRHPLSQWNNTDNPAPNDEYSNPYVRENTRISHPASWTGGSVSVPPGCTNANLNASVCKNIKVNGNPTYISPIKEQCQANYIVLLTDGEANHNHSEHEIKSMTGDSSCTGDNRDERCGLELVDFLNNQDQSTLAGDQTVTTYTIGFNFSGQFLRDLASRGGGHFYEATSADSLVEVFQAIIVDILSRTTSFATPSLTVNAFNKLFHRDDVYFSLFKPVGQVAWKGNVKKYRICDGSDESCSFGDIMDAAGAQAVGGDDRISDTARSYWSATADGSVIDLGGAGSGIVGQGWENRNVFTYTGSADPSNVDLNVDAHKLVTSNGALTADMLNVTGANATEIAQNRADLIDWIRGKDLDDEDEDNQTDDTRFLFNDPLHSSPVAVTYGGTASEPVTKLFVGTNDGALRMINGDNGKEEWAFYPRAVLSMQKELRDNFNGDHKYGMDGTPTVWVNDVDEDGVIEAADGDFVRVYATMRRGGRNIYAFDVTPASPIAASQRDTLGLAMPKLMWRIVGGPPDYPKLGYTWSRPKLTTIPYGTTTEKEVIHKTVLVFAGGYDGNGDTEDGGFGPSSPGNAIYIADAATGARLLSVSNATDGGSGQQVSVNVDGGPVMNYPIPSEVAMFDSNGDGDRDRIYVGDTGGQVWRVDLEPNITTTAGLIAKVRLFAQMSDGAVTTKQRKFFYRPDIVQVKDNIYSNTARYDLITLGSGNRADPLNTDVDDIVVALRDRFVDSLPDSDGDGIADADIDGDGTDDPPLSLSDLFDATEFFNAPTGDDLTGSNGLKQADGWYINLEANGEKGLAPPVVLAGRMFFTSYLPEGVVDTSTCTISEGTGRLYGVNLLTGAAFPWDMVNNDTVTNKESRYMSLGSGIPSEAVPIFMPKGVTLLIGSGGGAKTVDPGINLAREQTYWYR